jgi:hypothetical protein
VLLERDVEFVCVSLRRGVDRIYVEEMVVFFGRFRGYVERWKDEEG